MIMTSNKYIPPVTEYLTGVESQFVLCVSTDGDIHGYEYEDNGWEDLI